jgi:hypothetical protein
MLITGSLSGCLPFDRFDGPVAIRSSDGVIEVAFCTSLSVTELYIEVRQNGDDWQPVLDVKGNSLIRSGSTFRVDTPPEGFEGDPLSQPTLGPRVEVSVLAVSPADDLIAGFSSDGAGLPTDSWLHPDRSTTQQPCA